MPDKQDPLHSDSVTDQISAPWGKNSGIDNQTGESDRSPLDEGYVYVSDSDSSGDTGVLTEQLPLGGGPAEQPAPHTDPGAFPDTAAGGGHLDDSESHRAELIAGVEAVRTEQTRAVELDTRGFPLLDDSSFDDEDRGSRLPLLIGGVSLLGLVIAGGALALSSLGGSGSEDTADSSTVPLGTVETVAPTPSFVTGSPSVIYTDTKTSPAPGSVDYVPTPAAPVQDIQEEQQDWVQPQPSPSRPQVQQPSQQVGDAGQWSEEDARDSGSSGSQEIEVPSGVHTDQPNTVPEPPQTEGPDTGHTAGTDQNPVGDLEASPAS